MMNIYDLSRKYEFTVISYKGAEKKEYNMIVRIHSIPAKEKGLYAYQFLCEEYIYKDDDDSLFLEELSSVFNNLIAFGNEKGELVNFYSHKRIQQKWNEVKTSILRESEGDEIHNFTQGIDVIINDRKAITSFLGSDKMYGLFFNKQWERLKVFCDENKKDEKEIILENLPEYKFVCTEGFIREVTKRTSNHLYKMLCRGKI